MTNYAIGEIYLNSIGSKNGMALTMVAFLVTSFNGQASAEIVCPDQKSLRLLKILQNANYPNSAFSDPRSAYAHVIEKAMRPVDGPALRSACFRLASSLYGSNQYHSAPKPYGRTPSAEVIDAFKEENPLLQGCPEKAIHRDSWLPVERAFSIPSEETLAQEITGWVELEIVIDHRGIVEKATVTGSSNSVLERSGIDAVLKFVYQPRMNDNLEPVRTTSVPATVVTDYFDLARAKGCRWNDPRYEEE